MTCDEKGKAMKKKKQLNQISWTWNLAFIFILGIVALLTVLPLLLIVIISFSSTNSISQVGYNFFPVEWSFEGYYYTFKMGSQLVYSYLVTIAHSVLGTALGLLRNCRKITLPFKALDTIVPGIACCAGFHVNPCEIFI